MLNTYQVSAWSVSPKGEYTYTDDRILADAFVAMVGVFGDYVVEPLSDEAEGPDGWRYGFNLTITYELPEAYLRYEKVIDGWRYYVQVDWPDGDERDEPTLVSV